MVIVHVYNPKKIDPDPVKYSERIWAAIKGRPLIRNINVGVDYHELECDGGNPILAITIEDDFGDSDCKSISHALADAFGLVVKRVGPIDATTPTPRGWAD
jgi:hypothetical protein